MFGAFSFAWPRFADAPGFIKPPNPKPRPTYQVLVLDCKKRDCTVISGVPNSTDFTLYNFQDALYFNGTPISILKNCPTGYYCTPGVFPRVFTYPTGFFTIPAVINTGDEIMLQLQGCTSMVTGILPAGATAAQIQAEADLIIAEVAAQQADCDAIALAGNKKPDPTPKVPPACTEGYVFTDLGNSLDNGSGAFTWSDLGAGGTSSFSAVFTSPTPKTWTISLLDTTGFYPPGVEQYLNTADVIAAPTLIVNGSPVSFVSVLYGGQNYWSFSASGGIDGPTFETDACTEITVTWEVTGTATLIWALNIV